jgi:hypothetical protein
VRPGRADGKPTDVAEALLRCGVALPTPEA